VNHTSVRAALANAMVAMKAKYYGKGPTKAKAFVEGRYVFVVMEGGLAPHEEVMIADGKEGEVRSHRLSFESSMRPVAMQMVNEITGRKVLDYHSQIVFHPPTQLEFFVLEDDQQAPG
jgi:uncharacterized protein YbcI